MTARTHPEVARIFRGQIDWHVRGLVAGPMPARREVASIRGSVTDAEIVVTFRDGRVETYAGGRYAARKIRGCYAPLMPRRIS